MVTRVIKDEWGRTEIETAYADDPRVQFGLPMGPFAQIRAEYVPDRPVDETLLWNKIDVGEDGIGISVHHNPPPGSGVRPGAAGIAVLRHDELTMQPPLREERYPSLDAALYAVLGEPQG
jgi:hypothetical protein